MIRTLLTGANGFLGDILKRTITSLDIATLGRNPDNDYIFDITKKISPISAHFDLIIHAAGKAHTYPKTQEEKALFYDVNYKGTMMLLQSLSPEKVSRFVYISTVAVYGISSGENITEEALVHPNTPYGDSKWQAEQLIKSWCISNGISFLVLRLPLVAGPSSKGNLQKMITAIKHGRYLRIAKGESQKSIVWASDIARLIEKWAIMSSPPSGIYHLTDGVHPSFYELEEGIRKALGKRSIPSLPTWVALTLGKVGDIIPALPVNSSTVSKITSTFTFSDVKARRELGWNPTAVLSKISDMVV